MACPNKSSAEWKRLVAKVGEDMALILWDSMDVDSTITPNEEVKDYIASRVNSDPDYYQRKYKGFLKAIVGENPTPQQMVEAFWTRLKNVKGTLGEDVLVTETGTLPIFPVASVDYVSSDAVPSQMSEVLQTLKTKFNIPFEIINDPDSKWKGKYINEGGMKKVYVNMAYATMDTPFHEYYHPFVRLLKHRNPELFSDIVDEARLKGDTRLDEEEVVTNFLAKNAVARMKPTVFERFINFLRRFFLNKRIDAYSSLSDVFTALGKNKVDVSEEATLTEAYDKMEALGKDIEKKLGTKHSEHPRILDKLVEQAVKYSTSDSSSFYQNELGEDVAIRLTALIGDKDLGEFSNYGKKFKWTQAEYAARVEWARATGIPLDPNVASKDITGTIKLEGQEYTFEEIHDAAKKIHERARIKGKLIHSFLQYAFEEDAEKRKLAREQAIGYAKEYGDAYTTLEGHGLLKEIWANIEEIAYKADIAVNLGEVRKYSAKLKDKIAPEVTLVSSLLTDSNGNFIGTTADGVIEHANGDLSVIDWKTGYITSDRNTPYLLQFGSKFGLNDSKLNRAYLELAFRTLIIKEKFPEATFRDIKIGKINERDGSVQIMHLELAPYLATIGEYYKQTNPKIYDQLQEKGLLNPVNYQGVSKSIIDIQSQIEHLPHQDRIAYLKAKLATLHAGKSKDQIERDDSLRKLSKGYTDALLELEKIPGTDLDEKSGDIPYMLGLFKNLSDISNPKVQTFHKMLIESKSKVAEEKKEVFDKHRELVQNVIKEQKNRSNKWLDVGAVGVLTGAILTFNPWLFAGTLVTRAVLNRMVNTKTKDYWAFMWNKTPQGYFLNNANTYMNSDGQVVEMTKAQKEYRDFVKKTMADRYYEFASEIVAYDKTGRPVTRAKQIGLPTDNFGTPLPLPADFMPRIPKDFHEVREEENFFKGAMGITSAVKVQTRKYFTSFIEDSYESASSPIPFMYFKHGEDPVIRDENHSFDVEAAFTSFMTNMIYKKHMDSMYDTALGVSSTLYEEVDEDNKARYPNLSKFVDEVVYPQILGKAKAVDLQSKKWQTVAGPWMEKIAGIPKGTPIVVSQDRVLRAFKSSVSMMVLGFRVIGPIRNAAMIGIQNLSQSTRRPIAAIIGKITGVDPESFTGVDARGATTMLKDYLGNKLIGDEEKSKLWNMAKKMDWLPDDFPYAVNNDSLLTQPLKLTTSSHAFMFYQISETMGAMWHLAGLMKGTKVKDINGKEVSLWDAYDNKGNWLLGSRGIVENADGTTRELKELDAMEIKTLKRVNERLNGSYRLEERTAIENTVIGEILFQFKKYFYQFLKVNFQSEYKDVTMGKYVLTGKREDGTPKYQWMSETIEGHFWVLARSILAFASGGPAKLKKYLQDTSVTSTNALANPKARGLVNALNTAVWFTTLALIFMVGFDDDDKKTLAGREFYRLILDTSRGLHPKDIFDTAEKPIVAAQRLSDLGNAMVGFFLDQNGILRGSDPDKPITGAKTLLRALPAGGSIMQLQNWYKNYNLEDDPLLNFAR